MGSGHEVCDTPMVVWRHNGTEPPEADVEHMLAKLGEAATSRFGADGWSYDRVMRQIPDHFHAHARDPDWWEVSQARVNPNPNRVSIL